MLGDTDYALIVLYYYLVRDSKNCLDLQQSTLCILKRRSPLFSRTRASQTSISSHNLVNFPFSPPPPPHTLFNQIRNKLFLSFGEK